MQILFIFLFGSHEHIIWILKKIYFKHAKRELKMY